MEIDEYIESKRKLCKFYIYDEVVIHNTPDDFWVVVNEVVFNLTPLIRDRADSMNVNLKYLLAFGGKDLSHYFDEFGIPLTRISAVTGRRVVVFPPVLEEAQSEFCKTKGRYWWDDPFYQIGNLTKQERAVRIINTLTGKTQTIKVCEEDPIYVIQEKYKKFYNSHSSSYIWRKDSKIGSPLGSLILEKTLTENGLFPEKHGIGPPAALWLFYTDDFTIA